MILCILVPWTLFAQSGSTVAPAGGAESTYQNSITQVASAGTPAPKLFVHWILAEINNDSLMREEIADDLDALQDNPHNFNFMTAYLRPDKNPAMRLSFKAADIAIKCMGKEKEGVYNYQVLLRAEDYGHRSDTTIRFRFTFQAKTEFFPFTKAYMVTAISYPQYRDKKETQTTW
jgi:hypothetical protein